MTEINSSGEGTPITQFWKIIIQEGGRPQVTIYNEKLIEFCSQNLNYYNYVDYTGNYILVKTSDNSIIQEVKREDLKQEIKHYLKYVVKQEAVWAAFASKNWITDNNIHLLEKLPETKFNYSKKNEAYFFYRNGVVKVTPSGSVIIPYKDFEGTVWRQQINSRDFVPCGLEYQESVFNKFLINVSGKDNKRYLSLISIIGYILHPYKDPALSKAVILLDENIDFSGVANGGTGKSLIAKAIQHITSLVHKDGKNFNARETFVFDDIRPYHRVLYFDDVKRSFSFEEFYSMITSSLKVTRKYKDSTTIPPELSPKLLISSNNMVKGTGGDTDERRRIEFEVAPHYSKLHTPFDEFNQIFFDDWKDKEWNLFDNLMLRSVLYFIRNGIIEPPKINLIENKLKISTDSEFVVFMDSTIELEIVYDKAELIVDFIKVSPKQRNLSKIEFKRWIDSWADARGIEAYHYKSNGKALVKFTKRK